MEFEIYDIDNMDGKKPTVVKMRVYGTVGKKDVDYETTLVAPPDTNTYDKLAEHIIEGVLLPKMKELEPPEV